MLFKFKKIYKQTALLTGKQKIKKCKILPRCFSYHIKKLDKIKNYLKNCNKSIYEVN